MYHHTSIFYVPTFGRRDPTTPLHSQPLLQTNPIPNSCRHSALASPGHRDFARWCPHDPTSCLFALPPRCLMHHCMLRYRTMGPHVPPSPRTPSYCRPPLSLHITPTCPSITYVRCSPQSGRTQSCHKQSRCVPRCGPQTSSPGPESPM